MHINLKLRLINKYLHLLNINCNQTNRYLGNVTVQNTPKKKICVVGAGPAGFYATHYLLKHLKDSTVDVIDKLPVPFGLVRFGVAPDHPEVKNVINSFTKTAENKNFRFFGNLTLGKDISLKDLRNQYHAVLLTYGAEADRKLHIPNENQPNVVSARAFVAWYNGLPGAENFKPNLNGNTAIIIGQGNVAVDVARILLSPIDDLKKTDITEYALECLSRSNISQVYMVGRRGPLQAAFTIKELREILKLKNVKTLWRVSDFKDVESQLGKLERPRKRLTELMLKSLSEQNSMSDINNTRKQFFPIFLRAPKRISENTMEFIITELKNNAAELTNATEIFTGDLILRSIGYKSTSVDDSISFDDKNGFVINENGRVLKNGNQNGFEKGLYVAGWLATGPTGVIISTMNNAFMVAQNICDDILSNELDTSNLKSGISTIEKRVVTWNDWQRIDKAEVEAGKLRGKPREKIVKIEEMLKIAGV